MSFRSAIAVEFEYLVFPGAYRSFVIKKKANIHEIFGEAAFVLYTQYMTW